MPVTTINVQAIIDSINNARKHIDEQQTALSEINNNINSMNGIWEAEDQRVYAERFQDTKRKIETFNQGVRESLDTMQKYVNDCVSIDDQTGRILRNVSW